MSYTPTTWAAGDTVTSAKLNKIEQGIVTANNSGAFVVEMSNGTLNTKAGEIFQAFKDEKLVYVHSSIEAQSEAYFQIVSAIAETNQFVFVAVIEGLAIFTASGEDDYPTMNQPI